MQGMVEGAQISNFWAILIRPAALLAQHASRNLAFSRGSGIV